MPGIVFLAIAFLFSSVSTLSAADAFGNIFGTTAASSQSQSSSTGTSTNTGASQTESQGGFFTPSPIQGNRTAQLDKDGRAYGMFSFYLKPPGDVNVRVTFDFGPWAQYGLMKKVMVRDVNGNVMGGYADLDKEYRRMAGAYRLYVEKWNDRYGRWEKFADYPGHQGGRIQFAEETHYRLTVIPLEKTVLSLSPQSAVVTVKDPAMNRTGQIIYDKVIIQGVPAYSGTGISVDCSKFPKRDHGAGFVTEYPTYTFKALVQRARVKFESSMNRMTTPVGGPEPYRQATWQLIKFEGKSGQKVVATQVGGETFSFNPGHWGHGKGGTSPGRYQLEAHLAEAHQAKGVQQMQVSPGTAGITLFQCGEGKYESPKAEIKTFEGDKKKKCDVVLGASEAEAASAKQPDKDICIEADAFQQKGLAQLNDQNQLVMVKQPDPINIVKQGLPKDTPDVPVKISDDCPDLLRQIAAREKQAAISCNEPIRLMNYLLGMPQKYLEHQSGFADLWGQSLLDVKAFYDSVPIVKLGNDYFQLVKTAYSNGLVMSEEDQRKYDSYRMGETGVPLSLGHGIAPTAAVFDKQKVALLNQLRADQQRIYNEYGNARLKLEAGLPALKNKIGERNRQLDAKYSELLKVRELLSKGQTALLTMYSSGSFEHCLGMGLKTSMNYTITFNDGRQQQGAAWALPGMNLTLPEPKKQQIPIDNLTIPAPLHKVMPLRLKIDGIRQAEQDRKTAEALAEAARLAFEVENGSWLNWTGSWAMWLLKPTGIDAVIENIAAGNSVTDSLAAAGVTVYDRYSSVAGGLGNIAAGAYDRVVNRPLTEVMQEMDAISNVLNPGNLVPAIFEGLGEDVAKFARSKEALKEIEALMDEQMRLGNSTQANVRALEIANRINALWKEMDAGGKAMNNIIATVAGSGTVLKATSAVAGTKPLAALQGYIDDVVKKMATSQNTKTAVANAVSQKSLLEARIAQLEAAKQSGQALGSEVDEALAAAREALKKTGGALDEALTANQQAVRQLSDKLDDAVKNRQAQLEALGKSARDPENLVTVTPENIMGGNIIGTGAAGQVRDVGEGAIAKVFKNKDLFDDEVAGLKSLREAGIPHVPATQAGVVNLGDNVVTNNKNVIIKPKFTETQQPLQNVLDSRAGTGRVLTRQEQIEALEFYSNAAKKGVVFGDPNSGNLLKETLPDGSFRFLAVEGGSVAKVNPDQARQMMKAIFDPSLIPDNPNTLNKGAALYDAFAKTGAENIAGRFFNTGFSMADGNIAKHIDPDLLKKFLTSSPQEWDDLVNGTRKAQVLANDAIKNLQNTVDQTAAAVNAASNQLSNNAAGLQQQIDNAARSVQSVQSGSVMGGAGQQPVIPVIPSIGPQSLLAPAKQPHYECLMEAA